MKELTEESFAEMLTLCSQHSHFKVGITFDTSQTMSEFLKDIKEAGGIPGVSKSRLDKNYGKLEFYNGSVIEVLPCTLSKLRGNKFNQVLYNFNLDQMTDEIRDVLRENTVPYVTNEAQLAEDAVLFATKFGMMKELSKFGNGTKQVVENPSEELDSFLDSFKVSVMRCAPTCES